MTERKISIEGMTCNHCVMAVKRELSKLASLQVKDVSIGSASFSYDETKITPHDIEAAIEEAGYKAIP